MNLTEDRETFAARRLEGFTEAAELLTPAIEDALGNYGAENWFSPVVSAASEVWSMTTEDEGRRQDVQPSFVERLTSSLEQTSQPSTPVDPVQVARIANWLATFTINDATHFMVASSDDELMVEWVTMRDEDVRDLHRPLDGVRVPVGDSFQVGRWELQYPGQPTGDPEAWINCRCVLRPAVGEQMSADTFATEMEETPIPDEPALAEPVDPEEFPPVVDWATEMQPIPIHGVLVDTTEETGDGRHLAGDFDVLSVVDGPVPLRWVRSDVGQHDGAVRVATIDQTWREGDRILYNGHLQMVPEVDDVLTHMAEGRMGLSVDLDSAVFEVDESSDEPIVRYSEGRIRAATLVDIPALTGAWAELGSWEEIATLAASGCAPCQERMKTYREGFAPNDIPEITKDAPGWITNPRETSRLRNYWAVGPGAAKIAWGTPGDFNRCRANLAEYVMRPDWLAGLCANIHFDALGFWPGQHRGRAAAEGLVASAFTVVDDESVDVLPAAWFKDPELDGPTPITITEEGRVFGHIAQWGVCHTGLGLSIGMDDSCTAPPNSPSNYAYYRTGAVTTEEGDIPVGNLTMGIGHAGERMSAGAAIEHYDNVEAVVADVVAGEDAYGIWFSGAMRPNLTNERLRAFKASRLSGDWRRIGGELELVGALSVNVPGFPIPRLALAASGGRQTALIAAGIIDHDPVLEMDIKSITTAVEKSLHLRAEARQAKSEFRIMERKRVSASL